MNLAGLVPLGLCHLPVCRQAGHVLPLVVIGWASCGFCLRDNLRFGVVWASREPGCDLMY